MSNEVKRVEMEAALALGVMEEEFGSQLKERVME